MKQDKKYKWGYLLFFLGGLYMFIFFEDFVLNKGYVDGAITTKNKGVRSLIYVIAQNKYGFWIVRCIPLLVGLIVGKRFILN